MIIQDLTLSNTYFSFTTTYSNMYVISRPPLMEILSFFYQPLELPPATALEAFRRGRGIEGSFVVHGSSSSRYWNPPANSTIETSWVRAV